MRLMLVDMGRGSRLYRQKLSKPFGSQQRCRSRPQPSSPPFDRDCSVEEAGYAGRMIASPCTQLCTIDRATGLCLGCARTLDEIAAWSACDDAAKALILARVAARRSVARP